MVDRGIMRLFGRMAACTEPMNTDQKPHRDPIHQCRTLSWSMASIQ
jgi:hypothetical protein